MRVITGTARGRKLKELPGMETRPTTDRVKESIFNIIQFDVPGRKVLDLFAGTGQLGIEALSRGANSAVFVDMRKDAAALVRDNLKLTGFQEVGTVAQGDALSYVNACREKFDVVFLDPPYETALMDQALARIAAIDILSKNGIIVCESAAERDMPALAAPYEKGREYRYGKIKLTVYRRLPE